MRGDWIVIPQIALATQRFDACLALLAGEKKGLRSGASVHVHLGAAHVSARVIVLDGKSGAEGDVLTSGSERLVQIIVQRPIGAWHGDRFIVRDASATRTIGGGRVLDPFAPVRYRRTPERLTMLAAMQVCPPAARLAALIAQAPFGIDLRRFARAANLCDVDRLVDGAAARHIALSGFDFAVGNDHWAVLGRQAVDAVGKFHAAHPDELGPDRARLKRIAFPRLDAALYALLIDDLIEQGAVRLGGAWLHLPTHDNAPTAQQRELLDKALPRLLDTPFDPPWLRELANAMAQPEGLLRAAMTRASRHGELFQVVRDLFYHPIAIRDLAAIADRLQDAEGEILAAAFRDATGLGRKRAIQVLEFFDRVGLTRRIHDGHLMRTNNFFVVDPAQAGAATLASSLRAYHEHYAP